MSDRENVWNKTNRRKGLKGRENEKSREFDHRNTKIITIIIIIISTIIMIRNRTERKGRKKKKETKKK